MKQQEISRIKKIKERMKSTKAFTLIELIVVISILGIIVLLAAPKFLGHTAEAKMTQVKSDIKAYEKAIAAKLVENPDAANGWEVIEKEEMENYRDSDSLFTSKGEVEDNYQFNVEYIDIPEEELKDEVKSQLPGNFIMDSGGKVYYQDDNLKANNGKSEGIPSENPKNPTENPKEPIEEPKPPVEEPKDPNVTDTDGDGVVDSWDGDPNNPEKTINLSVSSVYGDTSGIYKLTTDNKLLYKGNFGQTVGLTDKVGEWKEVKGLTGVTVKEVKSTGYATFVLGTNDYLYAAGSTVGFKTGGTWDTHSNGFVQVSTSKVKELGNGYVLYTNGDLYHIGGAVNSNSGLNASSATMAYQKVTSNVESVIADLTNMSYNFKIIKKTDGKYYAAGSTTFNKDLFEYVDASKHDTDGGDFYVNTFNEIKVGKAVDFKEIKEVVAIGKNGDFQKYAVLMNNGDVYINDYYNKLTKAGTGISKFLGPTSSTTHQTNLMLGNDGNIYGIGNNTTGLPLVGEAKQFFSTIEKVEALSGKGITDVVKSDGTFLLVKNSGNRYFSIGEYSFTDPWDSSAYLNYIPKNTEMKEVNLENK